MRIPDSIEPAVGWRAWNLIVEGDSVLIGSVSAHLAWTPGRELVAECRRDHEPPDQACSCGVYATSSRRRLQQLGYHYFDVDDNKLVVIGEIFLWGGIIPGQHGWRAQYAYPKNLHVPYSLWRYAARLRAAYEVPVVLDNTFK